MKVLMLGDVVGKPGRQAVEKHLPRLAKELQPELIIANGENAAGGLGITKDTALPLFAAGVDVITLGNHAWTQREAEKFIDQEPKIVRPANYPPGTPGRGWGVFPTKTGGKVGVINLLGRTFMMAVDDPFRTADAIVEEIKAQTPIIIVDFHAEATSEKGALAWDLDGRVSAVVGTHTHVPTCDERLLPGSTAFITDVGMVGPYDSILGMKPEMVVRNFRTQMKYRYNVAEGPAVVNGVLIEIDDATGLASSIVRVAVREAGPGDLSE